MSTTEDRKKKMKSTTELFFEGSHEIKAELKKYKTVFELSSEVILMINKNGNIVLCSPVVKEVLGYSAEELVGLNIISMPQIPIESRARALMNFRKRLKGKEIAPYILEFKTKDNQIIFGEVKGKTVEDGNGKILGVVAVIKNVTEQINQKRLINESEEKFRKFAESTVAAIFIVSANKFVYMNKGGLEITEYTLDELKEFEFWDIIHPDYRDIVKQRGISRQQGFEPTSHYEFKINTKSGKEKWLDFTGSKMVFEGVPSLLGTAFDITKRKQTEQKIKKSESNYREFFTESPIGLYRSDINGKIIMANKMFLKILGYDSIENFNDTEFDKIGYLDSEAREKFLHEIKKNQVINNLSNAWLKPNGEKIFINENARLVRDENGKVIFFEGSVEDSTDRINAENSLREERRFLNIIMDQIPDAIYFKDLESKFIKVNKAILKKHNVNSEQEILGKSDADFFSAKHASQSLQDEKQIIDTGKPIINKTECETFHDKDEEWVTTTKMPLFDENKNVIGTFGISRDTTESKLAEIKIAKMNKELAESNASKDRFFSIMAHDLKSPFTALLGYSEFLVEDFDDLTTQEVKEFSKNINSVANNVYALLENLLDWSRIQLGKMECELNNIDLNTVTQQVVDLFKNSAHAKGITLVNSIGENNGVFADYNMTFTILRNLTSNAIKFTKSGGEIKFYNLVIDEKKYFVLEDDGIGIPENAIASIFEHGSTLTTLGTNYEKGTGLGLTLCRDMVKMMGGEILVKSEVGVGSKFLINFKKQL